MGFIGAFWCPLEQRHCEMGKIPDDEVREAIQRILTRKGIMPSEGIQTPR